MSPPVTQRVDSKLSDNSKIVEVPVGPKIVRREPPRDDPVRSLSLSVAEPECPTDPADLPPPEPEPTAKPEDNRNEESNGVGDKIKIFEKAAEDAASAGRASRPGSVRRPRAERRPEDELPPPPEPEPQPPPERHASLPREPQRIVRPEFRALASPAEVTIRSPSLGSKAPERFPSHGTAFRNVAATPAPAPAPAPVPADPARPRDSPDDDDESKSCKYRGRATASRGSSYFTRGSEEIWLVKKKDIEEIEERVLDSFRRAGRGGTVRGRRGYARSESLETGVRGAEWAGRAQTLKRQSSVACTCGHDKKPRARAGDAAPRPRARSHGDPADAAVLDKYETLV